MDLGMLVNNAFGAPDKSTNAMKHGEVVAASVPSLTHSLLGDQGMDNSVYTTFNKNHVYNNTPFRYPVQELVSQTCILYKLSTPLGGIDDVTAHAANHDRDSNPGKRWCGALHRTS